MKNLRISDLEQFLLVAREGSLREAARKLRVEAGSLSKSIRKAERSVGGSLFLRSSQGLSLTPRGVEFQNATKAALESLKTRAPAGNVQAERVLALGAPSFLTSSLLSRAVPGMESGNPCVRLRILNVAQDQMVSSAIQGIFDAAVHVGELDWPRSWKTLQVGMQRTALFARAGHPLGRRTTIAHARRYPFVLPIQWVKNRVYFGDDGGPVTISERKAGTEVSTADIAISVLSVSDQLAFLPETVARPALEQGRIQKIELAELESSGTPLYLSVQSDRVEQRTLRLLSRELGSILIR